MSVRLAIPFLCWRIERFFCVGIGNDIASDYAAIDLRSIIRVRNGESSADDRIVTCEVLKEIERINNCEVSSRIGGNICDSTSRWVLIYIFLAIFIEFFQWIELIPSHITCWAVSDYAILVDSDLQTLRSRESTQWSNKRSSIKCWLPLKLSKLEWSSSYGAIVNLTDGKDWLCCQRLESNLWGRVLHSWTIPASSWWSWWIYGCPRILKRLSWGRRVFMSVSIARRWRMSLMSIRVGLTIGWSRIGFTVGSVALWWAIARCIIWRFTVAWGAWLGRSVTRLCSGLIWWLVVVSVLLMLIRVWKERGMIESVVSRWSKSVAGSESMAGRGDSSKKSEGESVHGFKWIKIQEF